MAVTCDMERTSGKMEVDSPRCPGPVLRDSSFSLSKSFTKRGPGPGPGQARPHHGGRGDLALQPGGWVTPTGPSSARPSFSHLLPEGITWNHQWAPLTSGSRWVGQWGGPTGVRDGGRVRGHFLQGH